jgi:hypothetical protein
MITVFVFKTPTKPVGKVRSKAVVAPRKIEENPLVQFSYPSSKHVGPVERNVRLIAADDRYLIGLEILPNEKGGKPRHQFKKFRRDRLQFLRLKSFNPSALL